MTLPQIDTDSHGAVLLRIRVQPRAKREGIVGVQGDEIKVALRAPPVDGAANQALIAFFAQFCGIPKSSVELISGHQGRSKRISLSGISAEQLSAKLLEVIH